MKLMYIADVGADEIIEGTFHAIVSDLSGDIVAIGVGSTGEEAIERAELIAKLLSKEGERE